MAIRCWKADVDAAGAEVARPRSAPPNGCVPNGSSEPPVRLGDRPAEEPQEREHDRPADPVAERGDRADEGSVLAPPLVRVQRKAARLVREHGGELGVEHHHGDHHRRGERPEHHRAPAAEVADRVAERPEQEAGVGERDHEPVVPAESLDEMSFLDDCLRHRNLLRLPNGHAWATADRTKVDGWLQSPLHPSSPAVVQSWDGGAADHDHLRVRRAQGGSLRRALGVRDLRPALEHAADPGGAVRRPSPQHAARSRSRWLPRWRLRRPSSCR